jgi:2-polyprenyl-3-methyl-5-hydroxy-6-metoxy-1,4-benzoquinol methylase
MKETRKGDTIQIAGDYQARALREGPAVQRFWHHAKMLAIRKYLPPSPRDFVLDVGCGSGVVSSFLGRSGAQVLGIDINEEAISYAKEANVMQNVDFVVSLVDQPLPVERPVDRIYCLELIEHIYESQAESMVREFHRKLRPGGTVFLTTPNYRSAWPLLEWVMDRSGRFPEMAEHQHVTHYTRSSLRRLCEKQQFNILRMASMLCFSPWLAPLSWRLAERVFSLEADLPFVPGSILVAVLEKSE